MLAVQCNRYRYVILVIPPHLCTLLCIYSNLDISVRLRGGTRDYNGRVEVLYNGTWGTICDNNFDIQDANVVCKMLGYKGAWSTECCGFYGLGSGLQIWMDNVDCSGNESSLAQCAHGGWGGHTDVCSHINDVGVYCIPNPVVTPGKLNL